MTEKNACKRDSADIKAIGKMPAEACRKKLAELSKGIAHPARVEIVRMLSNRPRDARCVCGDIVDAIPLAQSTVSQHLKVLKKQAGYRGRSMDHVSATALLRVLWNVT